MNKERPILKDIVKGTTLDLEKFQNATLRPIIKMQHDMLMALFNSYLIKRKIELKTIDEVKLREKIKTIFEKDANFKNVIVGLIIGHFSIEEFQFYDQYSSEFNKRILQISIQRVQDTFLK